MVVKSLVLEYGTLRTLDYVIVITSLPVCDDPYLSHFFVRSFKVDYGKIGKSIPKEIVG